MSESECALGNNQIVGAALEIVGTSMAGKRQLCNVSVEGSNCKPDMNEWTERRSDELLFPQYVIVRLLSTVLSFGTFTIHACMSSRAVFFLSTTVPALLCPDGVVQRTRQEPRWSACMLQTLWLSVRNSHGVKQFAETCVSYETPDKLEPPKKPPPKNGS
eukprot:4315514-Amphidinium_carterae.1